MIDVSDLRIEWYLKFNRMIKYGILDDKMIINLNWMIK